MRYPQVAATLKSARLRKGLTQEQVARQVGTSRFHWIRLEQGLHRPIDLAGRIAEVLGVDEKALLADADDEEVASMNGRRDGDVLDVLIDALVEKRARRDEVQQVAS